MKVHAVCYIMNRWIMQVFIMYRCKVVPFLIIQFGSAKPGPNARKSADMFTHIYNQTVWHTRPTDTFTHNWYQVWPETNIFFKERASSFSYKSNENCLLKWIYLFNKAVVLFMPLLIKLFAFLFIASYRQTLVCRTAHFSSLTTPTPFLKEQFSSFLMSAHYKCQHIWSVYRQ